MAFRFVRFVAILLAMSGSVACRSAQVASGSSGGPAIIQPGAPGQASRVISAAQATDLSKVQHTPADVKFMQGMIGHHAQAVEMVALLKTRTAREDMQLLGLRIELSQEDEIQMMQRWLEVARPGAARSRTRITCTAPR